jgi:ribonuclease HII
MICGIDEAGRGPLAGPVCAAAVILPGIFPVEILNDSKKLSAAARERARRRICADALAWGIGWASAAEIDSINILQASLLAMRRAWEEMVSKCVGTNSAVVSGAAGGASLEAAVREAEAVIDGLYAPDIPAPRRPLVKADAHIPAVMAASILAKTARDRLMELYGLLYPEYGYTRHKGYPTKAHREALLIHGPSPIQRNSFQIR